MEQQLFIVTLYYLLGLTSAPFIFTKCLRPIVKYWRECNINIVLYLDDGLAFADTKTKCRDVAKSIQNVLSRAGFMVNEEKSCFIPTQVIEWLGVIWDSREFSLSIPEIRIDDTLSSIVRVISLCPKITTRELARVVGKVNSMSPVIGNTCCIMTRFCSIEIARRTSWGQYYALHIS